jgi:error-prone DNA polymerase
MTSKGYTPEYAERVFKQLEGFGSYGFPRATRHLLHCWYM